jgi:predicted transcriptional regulator
MTRDTPLATFLRRMGVSQAELARGIERSRNLVSRLCLGTAKPSKDTIDAILAFLSKHLVRRVTYEQVFAEERAA